MNGIPVLHAKGKSLAEAYENALVELYHNGGKVKTQYDKEGDPESIDATMNITIESPLTDPMIHKAFPGGITDLREYVYEMDGLKDNWVKNIDNERDTRWEYTYSQRLKDYGKIKITESCNDSVFDDGNIINQIEFIVDRLVKQPYSRSAQAITWIPTLDLECYDPPCLQSMWFRITENDGKRYLNSNIRFRSNDAWGAYFMNSFGFTMFIKSQVLDKIVEKSGLPLEMGRINWQADSWHIYGKDIQQFKERLYYRLGSTSFEDRVYSFYDSDIQEMYKECEPEILKKIKDNSERMKKEYGS